MQHVFTNQYTGAARPGGGLEKGTPLLLWKIWSQLSPILGENIFKSTPILGENLPQSFSDFGRKLPQIFSNFGRKSPSNFLRFSEKIHFKTFF
jgi:hypothetical protein